MHEDLEECLFGILCTSIKLLKKKKRRPLQKSLSKKLTNKKQIKLQKQNETEVIDSIEEIEQEVFEQIQKMMVKEDEEEEEQATVEEEEEEKEENEGEEEEETRLHEVRQDIWRENNGSYEPMEAEELLEFEDWEMDLDFQMTEEDETSMISNFNHRGQKFCSESQDSDL